MRIVIAMMQHETNTFSPVPTPLARFSRGNAEPVPVQAPAPQAALPVWFIVGIVVVIVVGMGTSYVLFGQ